MTIDGFISGQNGEMEWMKFPWSDDIINYVREITEPVDTIILGRKLAEGFIPHWTNVVKNPNDPEFEGGVKYTSTPKIVFSKTLKNSIWENTTIVNGDLVKEITEDEERSHSYQLDAAGNWITNKTAFKNLVSKPVINKEWIRKIAYWQ